VTVGFGLLVSLDSGWYDLRGSWMLVPIAHAVIGIPFVVRAALPILRSIDPRQRDAAALLGASPVRVWWAIDRPVLARALTVGAAFAFAVSMGEFGATAFLARRGSPTVPIAVAELLGRPGAANTGQAYALSVVLAGAVAVAVLSVEHVRGDRGGVF
jgi:thiamine transport system permease protein